MNDGMAVELGHFDHKSPSTSSHPQVNNSQSRPCEFLFYLDDTLSFLVFPREPHLFYQRPALLL